GARDRTLVAPSLNGPTLLRCRPSCSMLLYRFYRSVVGLLMLGRTQERTGTGDLRPFGARKLQGPGQSPEPWKPPPLTVLSRWTGVLALTVRLCWLKLVPVIPMVS